VRIGVLDPLGADLQPGPQLYPALLRGLSRALTGCLQGAKNLSARKALRLWSPRRATPIASSGRPPMMKTYLPQNGGLRAAPDAESAAAIMHGLWIDLIDPTPEERQTVNNALGMELPTRADMEEIEISSRLYSEDGALFMTALILANSGTEKPAADVVTFILAREKLITLRYIDPQPSAPLRRAAGAA